MVAPVAAPAYESISNVLPFHFPENPLDRTKFVGLPLSLWLAQLMTFPYLAPAGALQTIDGGVVAVTVTLPCAPLTCNTLSLSKKPPASRERS